MSRLAAALLLSFGLALAAWSFWGIARRYRTLRGFPWLSSVVFAAASIVAILALNALIAP